MIVRLKGQIENLLPTSVELEVQGVTYFIEISLLTSLELQNKSQITLEIAQIIREDSHLLYGFASKQEREIFLHILKVNGVGPKIALTILSSFSVNQFLSIVQTNNLSALKGVKGIGAKVAGKIMLEFTGYTQNVQTQENNNTKLAYDALIALGFKDSEINTALQSLHAEESNFAPNEIVKNILKRMGK
ncbi:Holliday junction branch migration protein RuvA [Helicobacter didelphidarum]|uniref:Holliday junction branch migration complex subunit RuvA n=1 Tax=Helicobacter didelphidarum TaxID=2040648 RepID=A0A3D8IRF8_9HELI|nr:Holliday junction branch migration protein RuvA [Helicobacter didelphidarum]RDU67683.1 Holliday junction branch migration protein RuvA [Helicobacter didelphidarum]